MQIKISTNLDWLVLKIHMIQNRLNTTGKINVPDINRQLDQVSDLLRKLYKRQKEIEDK